MFANKLPNHDDLVSLFSHEREVPTHSGRWFLFVPAAISSNLSLPWLNGLLTLTYIAIGAMLVCATFRLEKKPLQILTAGLLVTFPTLVATFNYMYTADGYFFGLLLVALAIFWHNSRQRFGWLGGAILILLATAIYQAWLPVAASLTVLLIINQLLQKPSLASPKLPAFISKSLAMPAIALILYVASIFAAQHLGGMVLNEHANINQLGQIFWSKLLQQFQNAYDTSSDFFIHDQFRVHFFGLPIFITLASLVTLIQLGIIIKTEKIYRHTPRFISLLIALLVLPLTAGLIHLLAYDSRQDLMVLYALSSLPLSVLIIINHLPNTLRSWLKITAFFSLATLGLMIYSYIVAANQGYLRLHFIYEQNYAYALRLLSRLENLPNYHPDLPIYLIGEPDFAIHQSIPAFDDKKTTTLGFDTFTDSHLLPNFLQTYLGYTNSKSLVTLTPQQGCQILPSQTIAGFDTYPAANSIQIIGEAIYVNFQTTWTCPFSN